MRFFLILIVGLSALLFPLTASAHTPDQPPFLKADGKYAAIYPVGSTSIANFGLPQDISPENYLINVPIDFELEAANLPYPSTELSSVTFDWNFGDGQKAQGMANSHTYTKQGTYVLSILAHSKESNAPQLLDSVMVNVMPTKDYQLPEVFITVDGQHPNNPYSDILKLDIGKGISADGSGSKGGSSRITSYTWDLGDQQTSSDPKVTHRYNPNFSSVYLLLRIKTADGFLADGFAQIENTGLAGPGDPTPSPTTENDKKQRPVALYIGVAVVVAGALALAIRRRRR